jgi:hypothetical protein
MSDEDKEFHEIDYQYDLVRDRMSYLGMRHLNLTKKRDNLHSKCISLIIKRQTEDLVRINKEIKEIEDEICLIIPEYTKLKFEEHRLYRKRCLYFYK